MIEFRDVNFSYGEENVLSKINFRVAKGQTIYLGGANGAGKSTVLKIINGIIFPTAGKYFFEGEEISQAKLKNNLFAKKFHQKIGYIWQNVDSQLFCASVEEEIAFAPLQMNLSDAEINRRVEDAIKLFGLEKFRKRAPYYLSGGEKKKTAFASIFVMNPSVWTLDEPLNELDEKSRDFLTEFLSEMKRAGKTIIFSSHEKYLAEKLADVEFLIDANHELKKNSGESKVTPL